MPGAAQVPVQAAGGLVADADDPVLAALAADGDLPLPQVEVTGSQAGQFGQPDAGRGEHRDDRGVAALGEAAARARLFQPGQLLGGEDRDQLVGDGRGLQPGHRVGQLVLGGQPLEELLQGAVLVAGVGGAVPVPAAMSSTAGCPGCRPAPRWPRRPPGKAAANHCTAAV